MSRLFRFSKTRERDAAIESWFDGRNDELGSIARYWFESLRNCGGDVREILHDGHPTACVVNAAFAYVDAFTAHVNLGFFHGAALDDPDGLLEGTGKAMRHVKLRPGRAIDCDSLQCLIETAYRDIQRRLRDQQSSWLIHRHHVPAVPGHCGPAIESALEHDPVAPRNEK